MLQAFDYLKSGVPEPWRYHGVLFWSDVTVDWLSVGMVFGVCSANGVRMQARGLVYPLFVAQCMRFGMSCVCSEKGNWVEYCTEDHEARHGNNVQVGFRLGEAPMWHIKLLLSKIVSLLSDDVC